MNNRIKIVEPRIEECLTGPSPVGIQTEALDALIPNSVQVGNHHTVILTPTDKALIIMYSFIGLTELVSASSGQSNEFIWKACIERSIRNLKEDRLIA